MLKKLFSLVIAFLFVACFSANAQYKIDKYVIGNGGGTSSNDDYSVSMTIGQPVIGITENDDFKALLGFWHTISQISVLEIILPGNAWSMISSYIIPEDTDIEVMLEDIETNMIIIRKLNGDLYFPALGVNTFGDWDVLEGYRIYMTAEDILEIRGLRVNPATTIIPIMAGWNMIAYLKSTSMSVETAFEDIVADILIVKNIDGDLYMPDLGVNTLGDMYPTQGYKVYAYTDTELNYSGGGSPRRPAGITPKAKDLIPEAKRTGNNSTVFVKMNDRFNGNEIGAYSSAGELIGSGMIHEGIAAITIWGDNLQTKRIDGAKDLEPVKFKMLDKNSIDLIDVELKNIESIISGDMAEQYLYSQDQIHYAKGIITEEGTPASVNLMNSPNPFSDVTYIQFDIPAETYVDLEIFSMDGRNIFTRKWTSLDKGSYTEQFNAENTSSGLYIIKLTTEFGQTISHMSIVK